MNISVTYGNHAPPVNITWIAVQYDDVGLFRARIDDIPVSDQDRAILRESCAATENVQAVMRLLLVALMQAEVGGVA